MSPYTQLPCNISVTNDKLLVVFFIKYVVNRGQRAVRLGASVNSVVDVSLQMAVTIFLRRAPCTQCIMCMICSLLLQMTT